MTAFVCVIQSHNILVLDIRELHLYYIIYKEERKITAFVDQLFFQDTRIFSGFFVFVKFFVAFEESNLFSNPFHVFVRSRVEPVKSKR